MHLDGFDLSGDSVGCEGGDTSWLEDTGLDTSDWDSSNTANLVDVLEWETEWLVAGANWWGDGVKSLVESLAGVPAHVGALLKHVIAMESGDWDEEDLGWVVADLLEVGSDLSDDFLIAGLVVSWLGRVHLVDTDNHLLNTEGEGEESVLAGLSLLSDTGLELTSSGGDDEDGNIGLGGSSNHVLDEITMAWGVNNGKAEFLRLEFPESNVDGDTTFTLGLQFVEYPCVLKGAFAHFSCFFLEFLDGTFVNATTLVDKMASGCALSRVDVTDNN